MPFPTISVPPFPNVPVLPGVPQLVRSLLFPASPAPTLGTPAATDTLWQSANATPVWGIFDSTGATQVVTPDSVLDFDNRNEWRVSNFPVQQGGFGTYNKVIVPFEVSVRMSKGGALADRTAFLQQIAAIAGDTNLYTILTPEKSYQNCNVTRYEVTRRGTSGAGGPSGAFFLTEVDVFFIQIIQVTAQYSTTAVGTQNAQEPQAQPAINNGSTQAQPVNSSMLNGLTAFPNDVSSQLSSTVPTGGLFSE